MMHLPKYFVGALAMALLFALARPASAEEAKGTVKMVNADKNEVVLKGLLKDTTYNVAKDAVVILDGRKCSLASLNEGDRAAIAYLKDGERLVASEVRCLRKADEAQGTIKSVTTEKNEIVLKGTFKDTSYFLDKDTTVWINGKAGTLSDLHVGDVVTLTAEKRGDQLMVSEVRCTRKA